MRNSTLTRRTPLRRHSPLRAKTPLRRMTPLKAYQRMRRTALAQQSKRAKKEAAVWSKVKKERMERLREKFGFVPCEYCLGKVGVGMLAPEGHHNDKNRRNCAASNLRILHRYCNQHIEDINVRGIPSLLDDEVNMT